MAFKFFRRLVHKQNPTLDAATLFRAGALINGRYHLDTEIGRGGMGIVYRAHEIPSDQDVALKVINAELANPLTYQQFLREAEIAARFHHPHIVRVYETGTADAGVQGSLPYIVMEWVQGIRLDQLQPITYLRILEIGKQICEALTYTHEQRFVYRDLKPANVLIEKRGFRYFVKLLDFGLARPRGMTYHDQESSLAGSFFYLAPELIAGQPADVPSDLYALGVTLYEMITGRVPFSDFDEGTVLSQHLEESVPPLRQSRPDVPPALEAIVLCLLAKNPEDRFPSAREVYEALDQALSDRQRSKGQGNLSLRRSSGLVGDENDIAQIIQLLESNSLVTLLGGSGTLTLEVGHQLATQFLDGVWWVDLGSLNDPAQVLETVASVLGVDQTPLRSLSVSLLEHVREKNLLLLLDHCDHFLGACAQLAETILHGCPDVWILATSQRPLNVAGEKGYRLTH